MILKTLFLALIAGGATFLGVFIGSRLKSKRSVAIGLSFAGAIMILISVFELIPAAYRGTNIGVTLGFLFIGALVAFLANVFIEHIHSVREIEDCNERNLIKLSVLITVGLVLHDFPEGFIIPSAFSNASSLGVFVVVALFLHNIPEGWALTCASGVCKNKKVLYKAALYSTLSTFFGAGLGLFFVGDSRFVNSILLALAAGTMLFISIHELVPFSRTFGKKIDVVLGFGVAIVSYFILSIFFYI